MKTKVVKRYAPPQYPARLEAVADPALLRENMPSAWQTVPPLAGAVALFLSANTPVCHGADKPAANTVAVVAPIFQHGEGRASSGCVVVSPPVFLSEEEALQVIREELTKTGVNVSQTNYVIPGITIKPSLGEFKMTNGVNKYFPPVEKALQVSAADPAKKVAVEFVTQKNYYQLGAELPHSTVQTYETKNLAQSVSDLVAKKGTEKMYFGTFYDPAQKIERMGTNWKESQEACRKESLRLLRLQVQDFVKWLQGQGAI